MRSPREEDMAVLFRIADHIDQHYVPSPTTTCAAVTDMIWKICPNARITVISPAERTGQLAPYRFDIRFNNTRLTIPQPLAKPILCVSFDSMVEHVLGHGTTPA